MPEADPKPENDLDVTDDPWADWEALSHNSDEPVSEPFTTNGGSEVWVHEGKTRLRRPDGSEFVTDEGDYTKLIRVLDALYPGKF